jgi:mannose-1-phosphate guanylyltransferase/phosphomannomutase
VEAFIEKPGPDPERWVTDLINAGVYVLEPSVLEHVPAGRPSSFERNLFPSLLASGAPVYGYELSGYWKDLGTPIAYLQAQFDLLEGRLHLPVNANERDRSQWFADGACVEDGAVLRGPVLVGKGAQVAAEGRVFGPAVLGPNAVVESGARVERSVLMDGAHVERSAKVSDSIIGADTLVGSGAVVSDGVVLGDRVVIEADNVLAGGVRVAPGVHLGPGAIRV